MVPPEVAAVETALALADTATLRALAALRIPDLLDEGPRTGAEIARRRGIDPDATKRILRFAASRGLVGTTRRGAFRHSHVSRVLATGHPSTIRDVALFAGSPEHLAIWGRLEDAMRTGNSAAEAAFAKPFFELLRDDGELAAVFDGAMHALSRLQSGLVVRRHDFSSARSVCDVGGGTGGLLADVLAHHPGLRGTLFDLPAVAEQARPVLERAGVAARAKVVGGDFFVGVPPGADRYLLQSVIHDWDDDASATILANARSAMTPGGRILVVEQVLPTVRGEHPTKTLDAEMLALNGAGRERTRAEFEHLFGRAGLDLRAASEEGVVTLFELGRRRHPTRNGRTSS